MDPTTHCQLRVEGLERGGEKVKLSPLFRKERRQEKQPLGKSRVIMSGAGQRFTLESPKQPFFRKFPLQNLANCALGVGTG